MRDQIWTVESDIEVPLRVLAPDWRTALCMALQLLELEELVARLDLGRITGGVRAVDPISGQSLRVTAPSGLALAA